MLRNKKRQATGILVNVYCNMEKSYQASDKKNDEISLKELVLKLREWMQYFLGKWLIILIFGILGAAAGLTFAFFHKPEYVGELTFVLEDGKSGGGGLSAYAGIASQFGIDLGGGSDVGVFSPDNIITFLQSRLLLERVLLSSINIDRKKVTLADVYLDSYDYRDKWKNKAGLNKINFPYNQERSTYTRLQDSVLNIIQKHIAENNLTVTKPDKKSNFIAVRVISRNEMFSKVFTELLVQEATSFYVATKTKRSKVNVDKLQATADSLEILLNKKTYSVAQTQQLNINPARQVASVPTEVQTRDKLVLQTMFGEVIKNLELSKITMAQETPVVQVIDTPILPLEQNKIGMLKGLVIGGLLGGILIFIYLSMKKLLNDVLM